MESIKIQIGLLEGKSNWNTWKYKVCVLLRGIVGAMDVVEGILVKPDDLKSDASASMKSKYESDLSKFLKAESSALIILTTNMTEETLQKVMRFTTAREVWMELHRLYDGINEDKAYDLCMKFFSYKKESGDDMASHMSKLKNLWNDLKQEIYKDKGNKSELPELLLICKILGTLTDEYFPFKSSWMLMTKAERTIDNLTYQLCAYERALACKENDSINQEVLLARTKAFKSKNKQLKPFNYKIVCHYCKEVGHIVKQCSKWKADGKPPKSRKINVANTSNETSRTNMTLSAITTKTFASEINSDGWFVDNGATNHVTNRRGLFKDFEEFTTPHTLITANGESISAIGKGTIEAEADVNGHRRKISLTDVWYVPNIQKNLFSVLYSQDKHPSSEFISRMKMCQLKINGDVILVGFRYRFGGLYRLSMKNIVPKIPTEINLLKHENLLQLYHERLGHQNKRHVKAVILREIGVHVEIDSELCEGCIYGKAHRLKFGNRVRATNPGELIHSDVCGPFLRSLSGHRYFVLFKDDFTRFRFVYFIKEKSEVPLKLKQFLAETKVTGHTVKEFLSDNGGEFDSKAIKNIFQQNGIKQRLTMPYTPEQNGCSERENRTIVETARAMMYAQEKIPQGLWAEMINTAGYILNRTGKSSIEGKSPYELWFKKKPSLKHLKIIGCTCFVHIPKQRRRKMDKKAVKGIFVGYDNNDGYRIWIKENNKLIRSRDVIFEEKTLSTKMDISIKTTDDFQNKNIKENNESIELEEDSETENFKINLRDRNKIKFPEKFKDYVMSSITNEFIEPDSYSAAIKSDQRKDWQIAMDSEMKSLAENNTWILQKLPEGRKAIPCKWIYRVKTNPDGLIDKFKARIVIKGFSQRKGIDYNETFSPVARLGTIRTLISIAASENMSLTQIDVSTAFLYGELQETIFMKQPEGFEDGTDRVCCLKRSLYGLKQAPRCWNKRFGEFLIKLGFQKCDADPCLFVRNKNANKIIFALYVDDGLIAATDKNELNIFIQELKTEFKITEKPASYYLGLEFDYKDNGSIRIHQTSYTKRILERFGMSECRSVPTPIIKESTISGKVDDNNNENFPYRQAVGALMYLMTGTRPDIAYAVGIVSRTLENPSKNDVIRVKRIFRYLQGTIGQGILYKSNFKKGILEIFSDADHGGDELTGRSTSGVVSMHAGGAISWLSQRQSSVAISTTEAEVVAASEAAREVLWLKRLLGTIIPLKSIPILHVDNEAATRLAQNPEYHRRTKHIRIRHFFVRELVTEGEIEIRKISTEFQLADILTKPLHKPRIQELGLSLGLQN